MKQSVQKKHQKLSELSKSYLPEWRFTTENPDSGSVVAILIDNMLSESEKRYDSVLHKHKIQYLNLFDRLKEEPIESAKSYVKFSPVTGMEEPVHIPKGTRLVADDEESSQQMIFETSYGITTTSSELASIFVTDREKDRIVRLFSGSNIESHAFTPFDLTANNEASHILTLGFDNIFDHLDCDEIALDILTVDPELKEEMTELFIDKGVSYYFGDDEGDYHLPPPRLEEGVLNFKLEGYQPVKTLLDGHSCYALHIKTENILPIEISGIRVMMSKSDTMPDEISSSGITQPIGRFLPFGSPMQIYAECGIECGSAFARRGAKIEMDFHLDFEMTEQLLPEAEESEDYKIVMKKSADAPKIETVEVRADYVLIEYYSTRGWKRLINDENAALLFNGDVRGDVSLSFICPDDMVESPDDADGYRLRLRLLRADNLYRIPCRIFSPIISALRFSYSYENKGLLPDIAYTTNNFVVDSISDLWLKNRVAKLFYSREAGKRAMYFGFTSSPWGSPLSLYFEVENHEDIPIDFTAEYLSPKGFIPVQNLDHTAGMLYSGSMLMIVPSDASKKEIFSEDLYWIRLICHNNLESRTSLPLIRGIYTNMARVENRKSRTEEFFLTEENSAVELQLGEGNLLKADVYVNEDINYNNQGDNWVKWEKRNFAASQGRYYDIDLITGVVALQKGAFATFPYNPEGPMVRVVYQSYQGSKANVGEGAIGTMESPIKFIGNVTNPMAAYGGYDGYNEESSASIISNMLRTRGRAVTNQDYFDIISQISYGVKQIKCCSGVNRLGEASEDVITVVLLIDEYEKGGHIFSAIKDSIRDKLLESSSLVPLGKTLILSQPHFVKFSVRIWLKCDEMENVYELQRQTDEDIKQFLDPLKGGFGNDGWEIGKLPTVKQLTAYLKMKRTGISIERIAMSAELGSMEYAVDDEIYSRIPSPFAMAVNGKHTVYVKMP